MKHAAIAAAFAVSLFAAPVRAEGDFPPAISVSGEASVSVPPDLAQVDAGVASDARTAREASDANNAAMGKVLLALKGAGIEEKDFQTSHLSLQPQYAPGRSSGPSSIVGYRASNRVTIKVRDVAKVAALVDTVTNAGANDIGGINFMVAEPSRVLDAAREKAFADARRKAEIYAKAAGITLGAPLSIIEGGAAPAPLFRVRAVAAPMMSGTPVAQGEETLSVTVNVSWAIKPAQ
jgi:uncharacterized protein YggE